MRRRLLPLLSLAILLAVPVLARAQEFSPPTVLVRVRSLDTIVNNFKLIATLAGREEIASQVHGLIQSKIGAKGLEGFDTTRPLGAFVRLTPDLQDPVVVALLPIIDEKSVLGLLENYNL